MSQKVRMDMLPRLRQRYAGRGREGKSRMIDELCEQFGYSRKHAIKLLNAKAGWGGAPNVRRGRPPKYEAARLEVLQRIWRAAEQPCGKRLVALLKHWLPYYESEHGVNAVPIVRHRADEKCGSWLILGFISKLGQWRSPRTAPGPVGTGA